MGVNGVQWRMLALNLLLLPNFCHLNQGGRGLGSMVRRFGDVPNLVVSFYCMSPARLSGVGDLSRSKKLSNFLLASTNPQ
jgi:hypothetical protein